MTTLAWAIANAAGIDLSAWWLVFTITYDFLKNN